MLSGTNVGARTLNRSARGCCPPEKCHTQPRLPLGSGSSGSRPPPPVPASTTRLQIPLPRAPGLVHDGAGSGTTLITHARTGAARFLSYEITVQHADHKQTGKRRSINGTVGLRVPRDVIKAKCAPYLKRGKPERRNQMVNDDEHTIVRTYGAEYRGLVEYYLLAGDVYRLNRLRWVAETSMLKTLACKHDSTVSKMADQYRATIETPYGPRTCFQVSVEREGRNPLVARFGGIPPAGVETRSSPTVYQPRSPSAAGLVTRLQAGRCELCRQPGPVDVHQVRKLADLQRRPGRPRPVWNQLMAKRRRKTLVVCAACHTAIHNGQPTATLTQ